MNKIKKQHTGKSGGQKRLPDDIEAHLVNTFYHLAEWKLPLSAIDVRLLVNDYI